MMPSVTCLPLSDVSVICRATYFQFPIQVCFSSTSVRQAAQRRIGLRNRTSEVAENVGRYLSCTRRTFQENDFELILTVKMESRHPVEGYLGSEFWAICNYCGVMAA